ncbi:hypothetical protein Nepgr_004763 [Nepenthes gracilis]|uniref:Uncharacterized protein n=1 Tax=Nepenthes gracilis TaxID=150966 RepID=A0AAD3XFI6_NEPGR|nr:hypothetical protein Nepgr_004763 [Nepenthes gracilis]
MQFGLVSEAIPLFPRPLFPKSSTESGALSCAIHENALVRFCSFSPAPVSLTFFRVLSVIARPKRNRSGLLQGYASTCISLNFCRAHSTIERSPNKTTVFGSVGRSRHYIEAIA